MFIAESASEKCFKSVNIWHSYGQKGGLSSSFSSVVAQTHKVHETTTFLLQTLLNIHQFFFTGRLSNKPFLIWLLRTPPNLKYVATLLCNLLLIACFLTLMFRKVVWQHMQGVLGFLINIILQIY